MARPRIWSQEVIPQNDTTSVLILTHPNGLRGEFLFSSRHTEKVLQYGWHFVQGAYPRARIPGNKGTIRLHEVLMDLPIGRGHAYNLDHKNRDIHDNRDENIEVVTKRSNSSNKSTNSPHGRNISKSKNTYSVSVGYGRTQIFTPGFKDLEKAKQCRDAYLRIAEQVDNGHRAIPTREELKLIADEIRSANGT